MARAGVQAWWVAALCAAAVALLSPAAADATYPGANGPILILDAGGGGVPGLTAVDPNSGAATRIADRIGVYAAVSADGRSVVYTRPNLPTAPDFVPSTSIFMANIDGTGERLIADRPFSPVAELALSPDAGTVAYWSERDSAGLFSLPVAGGEPSQLTTKLNDSRPEYSPDGTKIVFERWDGPGKCEKSGDNQRDVWIANADGTGARPVADHPFRNETDPRFTPDGKRITYLRSHGEITCTDEPTQTVAIHSIRLNGKGDRKITKADGKEKSLPIPSPDGRRLLLIRRFHLITVPMRGKGKAVRVPGPAGVPVAWAPAPR